MAKKTEDQTSHAEALEQFERTYDLMRDNINRAYTDMDFADGVGHWSDADLAMRNAGGARPALVFNKAMSFVRQATNDMRQMKPAIKVVPVDDGTDQKKADILSGIIRHIEEASNAKQIYAQSVDSQVISGFGAWRVNTAVNRRDKALKDIVIEPLKDQIMVMWDADSNLLSRKDADHCFIVEDYTPARYKKLWPDGSPVDMPDSTPSYGDNWTNGELIRVAQYWTIDRSGDGMPKVGWRTMSGADWLDEWHDWPGSYIPIVSIYGQVLNVGKRVSIKGMVADIKDAQRAYNYGRSTEIEVVALQPKAPWLGTETNFLDYQADWETANTANHPYLTYTPDPKNSGQMPSRVQPPVSSQGVTECIAAASEDMKAITGIYDASLGARSNETSGVAIKARQMEGDVGTYHFMENFSIGIGIGGEIIVDLIPHVYDTERVMRIIGEDGAVQTMKVNQQPAMMIDGMPVEQQEPVIDLTVGEYDVVTSMGPSYSTKREAARDGMIEILKVNPTIAPMMMDLVIKMMDVPYADKLAKRLRTMLPPQIQQLEAQEDNEPMPEQAQGPQPDPNEMMKLEGAKMSLESDKIASEAKAESALIDLKIKELAFAIAEADATAKIAAIVAGGQAQTVDTGRMDALEQAISMFAEHMAGNELNEMQENEGFMPEPEPEPPAPPDPNANFAAMMEQLTKGQEGLAKAILQPKRVSMARGPDGSLSGRSEAEMPETLPVQQ